MRMSLANTYRLFVTTVPFAAEQRAGVGDVTDAEPQRGLILGRALAIPRRQGQTGPTDRPVHNPPRNWLETTGPVLDGGRAPDFFRKASDSMCLSSERAATQPLQPAVFFLQVTQPTEFANAEVNILLFPGVKGLLGDAELPADIADGGSRFGCRMA
jgi:hypothetical protein